MRHLAFGVVLGLVLVALLAFALAPNITPQPVAAQSNTACYRPVGGASFECGDGGSFVVQDGAQLVVESGGTLDVQSGSTVVLDSLTVTGTAAVGDDLTVGDRITSTGNLAVGGDATVTGALNVTGNSDVTGNLEVTDHPLTQAELYIIPPSALTVTDGMVITPTGSVMELTAAGAVGAELIAAGDGQLLVLINIGAQTITISDTTTIESTGDIALGQYDTLTLMGSGVKWYQLAASNN